MKRTYHSRKFLFYVAGLTGSQVLLISTEERVSSFKKKFNHETNLRHKKYFLEVDKAY